MKTHVIDGYKPWYSPAYLANGLIGVRVGANPLLQKTALEVGFSGVHEVHAVEAYAPLPAPAIDLIIGRDAMSAMPDRYELIEQAYDFSCGELRTRFRFRRADGASVLGEHLAFCSRTLPTLLTERLSLTAECDMRLGVEFSLDIRPLPVRQLLCIKPQFDCDIVMQVEGRLGISSAGIALRALCEGERLAPDNGMLWGYENEVARHRLSGQMKAGETVALTLLCAYVPSTMHAEPHWQAVRTIELALWNGYDAIRAANAVAWVDIWKGRVVVKGADERWQDAIDASYFYLFSTMHSSSPYGIAPYGLSDRHSYKGHVFWDNESFMFLVPLLSDPHVAEAMLDYRFDRIHAARNNARLNGYRGLQFPWQSLSSGDEVTRVSAAQAGGAGEQHVNLDVAMAFAAYARVSHDPVFLREKAWPVLRGVAEWIESRVAKTERGYEILHVCGIDESRDNVDNDAFTNIMCRRVLEEANEAASSLGYPENVRWRAIAEGILIPINREFNVLEQFEGIDVRPRMAGESLMAFFPYGYRHSSATDESTYRFYIEHDMWHFLSYPMLSGFLGIFPAWLGDREMSRKYFERANLDFFCDPYWQSSESGMSDALREHPYGVRTIFLTGRGSFLAGLMMGLTRLNIWKDEVEDWFEGPIVLPEGWEEIEVGRIWVRGKPALLRARQGAARAELEWLPD